VNRPLRWVAVAALVMFVALLVNSNILQVGEASSLRANPHNVRVLFSEYSHKRGPILVGGTEVARSVPTNDSLKYLRTYPEGKVYAPVTGFYSLPLSASGIEQAEDPILAGSDDKLFLSRISDEITGQTPQGGSVVLSINAKAQQAAYNGLKASGHPGAVVALDPKTGAILALASYPSYDPSVLSTHNSRSDTEAYRQLVHDPANPLLDRALNQTYPPGSTFKVVTTATALSSGKYTPNSLVDAPNSLALPQTTHQLTNFAGETCGPGGKITLTVALTVSCNTAYGGLGLKLGAAAISQQAKRFGFGQTVKTPIQSSPSRFSDDATGPNVAFAAIGQYDDSVTPLQMAMVASGIADGGVVMRPYLVAQTRRIGAQQRPPARAQPGGQQPRRHRADHHDAVGRGTRHRPGRGDPGHRGCRQDRYGAEHHRPAEPRVVHQLRPGGDTEGRGSSDRGARRAGWRRGRPDRQIGDVRGAGMPVTRPTAESLAAQLGRESGLTDARVLDIVGQVGFALQALHDQGRAHGAVTADAIALYEDGAVMLESSQPAELAGPAAMAADLAALGSVGSAALSADADPAVREFLARLANPPRGTTPDAGDVARTALALAAGPVTTPTRQAAPAPATTRAGTPPAGADPVDPEQRRVRNRFIAVGAVVVLVGLVLLKACGGGGQRVPNVTGDTYSTAVSALHAHGFTARERTRAATGGQRVRTVVGQDPAAGTRPRAGTTITLTVAR
jgi:peptidoglycan glycosyltransferase